MGAYSITYKRNGIHEASYEADSSNLQDRIKSTGDSHGVPHNDTIGRQYNHRTGQHDNVERIITHQPSGKQFQSTHLTWMGQGESVADVTHHVATGSWSPERMERAKAEYEAKSKGVADRGGAHRSISMPER